MKSVPTYFDVPLSGTGLVLGDKRLWVGSSNSQLLSSWDLSIGRPSTEVDAGPVGSEGKKGRWGIPTMALPIGGTEGTSGNSDHGTTHTHTAWRVD